jgi:cation transport regulator ChaC
MAIIAGFISGPMSIAAHPSSLGWYSVWTVAAPAVASRTVCLKRTLTSHCSPCGREKCHSLLEDGTKVQALGFVLERHLPSYAGNLPDSVLTQVLASASGRYGSTWDYVEQTIRALRTHAMPDLSLEARFKRCRPALLAV